MKKLLLSICVLASVSWGGIVRGESTVTKILYDPQYLILIRRSCDLYRVNRFTENEIIESVLADLIKIESGDYKLSLSVAVETDPALVKSSYVDAFLVLERAKSQWIEENNCEIRDVFSQ